MQVARVAPDWPVPSLMHRRRVLGDRITYVGLDVHKDGIVVAVAEGGLRGEVRDYGRVANTPAAVAANSPRLVIVHLFPLCCLISGRYFRLLVGPAGDFRKFA